MSTKLAIGAGLAGLAFWLSKNKETVQSAPNLTIDPVGAATDHSTLTDNTRTLAITAGMDNINRESKPEYNTWKRQDWALWYRYLLQDMNSSNAINIIWPYWDNPNNPIAFKIPSPYHLERLLALWQPQNSIGSFFDITADSSPVYDTWTAWWNNLDVWNCPDWMAWFDAMKVKYGNQTATQRFTSAWANSDNWAIGSNGYSCSQDCDFIQQMINRGIDIADTGMHTLCSIMNIPHNVVKAGENVSKGILNTSTLVRDLMPVAVVAALGYTGYRIANA